MDFGNIFVRAGQLVWRHKFLWLLGLLMGISHLISDILRLVLKLSLPAEWLDVDVWSDQLFALQSGDPLPDFFDFGSLPENLFGYLAAGIVVLMVAVLVYWIIVTVAEGGIIGAVNLLETEDPADLGQSLQLGVGWLKRFVAIDALVFFPWFIIALVGMLVVSVALVASLFMALQDAAMEAVITVYGLGIACGALLGCLLIPIGAVSIWYRGLAFRDTAILDHGVKQATRHPWQIIKQNFGDILLLTIFLGGIKYLVGWGLSLLSLSSLAVTILGDGLLAISGNILLLGLATVLRAVLTAFTATAWTIGYRELVDK